MSIAHVSKYPENDNAGLEAVHSSLGGFQRDARRKVAHEEERKEGNKLSAGGVVLVPAHTDKGLLYTTHHEATASVRISAGAPHSLSFAHWPCFFFFSFFS